MYTLGRLAGAFWNPNGIMLYSVYIVFNALSDCQILCRRGWKDQSVVGVGYTNCCQTGSPISSLLSVPVNQDCLFCLACPPLSALLLKLSPGWMLVSTTNHGNTNCKHQRAAVGSTQIVCSAQFLDWHTWKKATHSFDSPSQKTPFQEQKQRAAHLFAFNMNRKNGGWDLFCLNIVGSWDSVISFLYFLLADEYCRKWLWEKRSSKDSWPRRQI